MAKQIGDKKITGTIDDICFYIREGVYLARQKSSLTRKRFFTDPAFEGSRRSCNRLGFASKLASALYKYVEKENKSRDLFRSITGQIKIKMKEGVGMEEIVYWFKYQYLNKPVNVLTKSTKPQKRNFSCFKPKIIYRSNKRFYTNLKQTPYRKVIDNKDLLFFGKLINRFRSTDRIISSINTS